MLRSNTAHLQSEDKFAEPPQEQRARRRVTKKKRKTFIFLFFVLEAGVEPARPLLATGF